MMTMYIRMKDISCWHENIKEKKNKKIKGWGVFLYILLSMLTIPILGVLLTDSINVYFPNWLRYFTISDNPFFKQLLN